LQGSALAAIAVIPARFSSTRFPGKIVASATGKPLVQHVVERARLARTLREVVVAADDPRIAAALRPFGTRVILTAPDHQSGTDRIAEVASNLRDEIIVNVQGDEPEIEPETIDALVIKLESGNTEMATAATPFTPEMDPRDPNLVKVVLTTSGKALYFSRSLIPYNRDSNSASVATYYLHQGIYAYRRDFLLQLAVWPQTILEKTEKLEQLRVLENGRAIDVIITDRAVHGIDTPEQYQAFVDRYNKTQPNKSAATCA
jgi:3-deoxy-manno-octulosonate cytidylyltransferase (CMP-KDO synthetase)